MITKQFDPIVEEYFEERQELWTEIIQFEKRRGLSFLRKLSKDKDSLNFFSWLAEVRFGLFFDKISQEVKNDVLIEGQRPDWTVIMNGQKILVEVLRINSPDEEERNVVELSRQMRKFQRENPGTPLSFTGEAKTVSLEYLGTGQSKMEKKEIKYRDIIQKQKLPFIICVAPSLQTFLFGLDFSDFLMGNQGFFKRNLDFGRNVSGVLLQDSFGQYFYYHNEDAAFALTTENIEILKPFFFLR